jgi:hypothetical protein
MPADEERRSSSLAANVRLLLLAEMGRSEEARAEAVLLGQQGIRYGAVCLR